MDDSKPYDSMTDTLEHRRVVAAFLNKIALDLVERGQKHDGSKLEEPEKSSFDIYTPKLKETTYGSDEYRGFLREMKSSVQHHYQHNRHHPEHFADSINGMSLVDLIEMLCDWMAATKRMKDGGDIGKSIQVNTERFKIGPQLAMILENMVRDMEEKP